MISYIRGYYVITVEGVSVERFLNHLMRNGIKVYNVKKISSTKIEFNLERGDIKKFKNVYRGRSIFNAPDDVDGMVFFTSDKNIA